MAKGGVRFGTFTLIIIKNHYENEIILSKRAFERTP